jgi:hypothetical protein
MNASLEEELKQYYTQFVSDHQRLRDELLTRLPAVTQPLSRRRSVVRTRAFRVCAGLAASVAVALLVGYPAFAPSQPLYARVLESLKAARSIHLVAQRWELGRLAETVEIWYDRDRGTAEKVQSHGRTTLRLDDGTHQWCHQSGDLEAFRTQSVGPLAHLMECLNPEKLLKNAKPDPSGDTAIDGAPCRLYRLTTPDQTIRGSVWIDADFRARRYLEQVLRNDKWTDVERIEVAYDLPVDPDRFARNFGPDVKVVDAAGLLEERFSPAKAIYRKESMGLMVAVHELRRVDDKTALVVFSTRATEETVRRLGPIRSRVNGKHLNGSVSYGDLNFIVRGKRDERTHQWIGGFRTVPLAYCCHDGVKIEWILVRATDARPARMEALEFGGILHTSIGLAEERRRAGLPTYEEFKPMALLPLAEPALTLFEAVGGVYRETRLLAPWAFQVSLCLGTRPFTEKEIAESVAQGQPEEEARKLRASRIASPAEISLKDYRAEVNANIGE